MKNLIDLIRDYSIIDKMHLKEMAKINRFVNKQNNSYYDVDENEKKKILKVYKKKLWTNKFGIICCVISIITLITLIALLFYFFNDQTIENLLIFSLVLLIIPGTSAILAQGLKISGPLLDIYTRANNFVTFEDDSLVYTFDVLDTSTNNVSSITNRISYKINYSDISKITYNETLKRYTIYGDFKKINYLWYNANDENSSDRYADSDIKNSHFYFYDFFDKKDIYTKIEDNSKLKIENVPKKEITHKFNFIFLLSFYLFILLFAPITWTSIVIEKNGFNFKEIQTEITVTQEDTSIMYNEEDYEEIKKIIRNDLGDNSHIIFYTNGEEIKSNNYNEKYRYLNVLAYTDNSNDVYSYIFYKYITKSNVHDLGELELNISFISKAITKEDLKKYEER